MTHLAMALSQTEEVDRVRLEQQVEQGFYLTGSALRELRDRKLWRSSHGSFEEYCRDRFGFVRRQAERLIAAVAVYDNLRPNGSQIMPTNERQIRELVSKEPDEQRRIWDKAIERSGGKAPSGRTVEEIAKTTEVKKTEPSSSLAGRRAVVLDETNPYYQKTVEIVDGFPFDKDDMMIFFRGAGSSGADMPCRLSLMQLVEQDQALDATIIPDPLPSLPKSQSPKLLAAAELREQVVWLKQILREIIECASSSIPEPLLSNALSLLNE